MKKLLIILSITLSGCAVTHYIPDRTPDLYDNFDGTGNIEWKAGQPWGMYHPNNRRCYWTLPTITDGNAYFNPEINPKEFKEGIIPYSVGKMYTVDKMQYGYWEIRCFIQPAQGMRTAFWMWAGGGNDYREIDVFEYDHFSKEQKINIHYGERVNSRSLQIGPLRPKTLTPGQWQTFGFKWTPDCMDWFVDGRLVHRMDTKCILDWFNRPGIDVWTVISQDVIGPIDPVDPGYMIVDYVKYYEIY